MTDHTPGPWKAVNDDRSGNSHVEDACGRIVASFIADEEHAALIASAPDLLAENKRLRAALEKKATLPPVVR